MSRSYEPDAVTARLREAARLSDLAPQRRLDAKIDYSPEAVDARLRQAAMLLASCRRLAADEP